MERDYSAGVIKRLAFLGGEGIEIVDQVDGIGEVVRPMSVRHIRGRKHAAETALSAFPDTTPSTVVSDASSSAEPSTDL